jgi:hypothetical protein
MTEPTTEQPAVKGRRREDNPREHAIRFVVSLAFGCAIATIGVVLRVAQLIGEATLVLFVFGGGVVVTGESLTRFARTWRKNGSGDA